MEKTALREKFGRRVRQLREAAALTQRQLAHRVGMNYKYLGSVERGERNITIDNIQRIADALEIESYQLFLFSLEGLKRKESITEEKIDDLLKRCGERKRKLVLQVMADILRWEG